MPLETWWNPLSWSAPYPVVVGALFVIACLRAGATYALGRAVAAGGRRLRGDRVMERPGFARAVARINRWGAPAVTASFLTVGVQTMVNFSAGVLRMPLLRYLPALAIGALLWGLVYASVGFVGVAALVAAWELHPALAALLAVALVAVVVAWVRWQLRHPAPDVEQ